MAGLIITDVNSHCITRSTISVCLCPSPFPLMAITHHCLSLLVPDIAALAEQYSDLLVPDEGAPYDRLVEINLDEVK